MKWKIGDKLRITNRYLINGVSQLTAGKVYEVVSVAYTKDNSGHASNIYINDDFECVFCINAISFRHTERVYPSCAEKVPQPKFIAYLNGAIYGRGDLAYMSVLFNSYVVDCEMYGSDSMDFRVERIKEEDD